MLVGYVQKSGGLARFRTVLKTTMTVGEPKEMMESNEVLALADHLRQDGATTPTVAPHRGRRRSTVIRDIKDTNITSETPTFRRTVPACGGYPHHTPAHLNVWFV